MGYSRDSYYRLKELYDKGGVLALQEKSRKKPNLKNRVDESVETAILNLAFQQSFYGQSKASEELKKQGVSVSPAGVRSVWQRYDLENFKKRLKALGTKMLQDGYHPDAWQVKALQQAQSQFKDENSIDTYFPGHLIIHSMEAVVSNQTLGTLYQYVLVDAYSQLAFVYLCNKDSTDCAVKSMEKKMIPFFAKEELKIYRMATTKKACFYGKTMNHKYRKFINEQGMTLSCLPKKNHLLKPLRDFLKRINNEFYSETFRTKTYNSIAAIQADLDIWVENYNTKEPVYERYNYGKTPMATFKAILPFTKYLKNGKSKEFPNGLHDYMDLLKPLVIPTDLK